MSVNIINIDYNDAANSITGFTVSLWFAGCSHKCKGCFNPESWCFDNGVEFTDELKSNLFNKIRKLKRKNVSFLGGDILCSIEGRILFNKLVREIKEEFPNITIYIWTGYTKEQVDSFLPKDIYEYIDYMIDGRFDESLKNLNLKLRGSSNQNVYIKGELSNL